MNTDFAWLPLDDALARLHASGADADHFLQGQLSNDLRKLAVGRGQLSSYNSPKGRMLAVLTLTRDEHGANPDIDPGVDIELPRSLLEPIGRRLRMFVLRAKVRLVESTDAVIGLHGAAAAAALENAGLPAPVTSLQTAVADGLQVMRRHGEIPRFTLHGARERLHALTAAWNAAGTLDLDDWTLADVLAGVPVVLPPTQDHFVAQMANLDWLGGISFDKGCYTGQEIVARLHYLGQLKRRMFLCRGPGAAPQPGTPVHADGGEQSVGEIVQAATLAGGGFAASVVLQIAQAGSATLRAGSSTLGVPMAYAYDSAPGVNP